ncbi:hypothetical protein [Nocardioides sp. Soil805]|uniref:hypothetical protein n=1 Tax=Nocardioides sp. Soil805 TaxID=1736416 RepID=UPI0007025028|nr:hypothetical protein [Nocardioides sp. Soil805]KRF37099.1 hypothetical protein ASG94_06945 [Nocardioides sp. Soil805]
MTNLQAPHDPTAQAERLVTTIGAIRTLLLVLTGLATVVGAVGGLAADVPGVALVALLYGTISGLTIYVLFGWFQQTLAMLAGIFRNTAR